MAFGEAPKGRLSRAEPAPSPDHKAKGWEFTDLSGLAIDAYGSAAATTAIEGAKGATVLPLAEAIESQGELIQRWFGSLVPIEDPFVARNEADWRGGVLVHVPRGVKVIEPIRSGSGSTTTVAPSTGALSSCSRKAPRQKSLRAPPHRAIRSTRCLTRSSSWWSVKAPRFAT